MNGSKSPSSTRSTSPTSNLVRKSLIIWYGCITYERIWLPNEISFLVSSRLSVSACRFCSSISYSRERSIFIANSRFLCWLRSAWQPTTIPLGMCVMRTAVSTLLTFCPRMPPRRLIERRNPHQPVHSRFSREQPISVFAAELHCGVLNARLFSRRFVQHRRAHSLSFRPAQIHPQKDGRPILRLRPSRTGLDRHDGVQMIVFSRKQRLRFQFRDVVFRRRQLFIEVLQQLVLLFGV